ncbi:hypothetical protein AYO38_03050 [bacterium SCGC AG-212-C10]|nr:hypothetical protein AYO38_03050 [bacterium SCGC AG-212-C10]
MQGTVMELLTATAAGETMTSHEAVLLVPGVGIAGDRYATKRGHWSDPRWPDQELTLVEEELLAELQVSARQFRRNIVTRGASLDELIGHEFVLGEARLLAVRVCDPCAYIEGFTRRGLLKELGRRGGLRAHIIEGGRVALGDRLERVGGD